MGVQKKNRLIEQRTQESNQRFNILLEELKWATPYVEKSGN